MDAYVKLCATLVYSLTLHLLNDHLKKRKGDERMTTKYIQDLKITSENLESRKTNGERMDACDFIILKYGGRCAEESKQTGATGCESEEPVANLRFETEIEIKISGKC